MVDSIQNRTNNSGFLARLRILTFGRNPKFTLVRVAIWAAVCVFILKIALVRVEVIGISMLPTCQDRSKNWINCLAYFWHEPRRGDVVGIRFSREEPTAKRHATGRLMPPHVMLMKRVIGLPGETVAFVNGRALINGEILDEPYEHAEQFPCNWNCPEVKLSPDEYFVVGDNRSMPQEDHVFGRCKRSQIVGRILR